MIMIKSLLKQIWNQRKSNLWIFIEMMLVLVLLWYGIDIIYNYECSAIKPKGFDTENVFDITVVCEPKAMQDSVMMSHSTEYMDQIYKLIGSFPGVESECYYQGCVPYTNDNMFEGYSPHSDSTHVVDCYIRYVNADYFKVFRLKEIDGKIDESLWKSGEYPLPALMSKTLSDSLFRNKGAVGKTCFNPYYLGSDRPYTNYKVMAVLSEHKLNDYSKYEPFIYLPISSNIKFWNHIAIRVNPDAIPSFKEKFLKEMPAKLAIGPFHLYEINSYEDMKEAYDIEEGTVNYLNSTYAMIGFFIFNVFLGMLGTFWFRTRKRRSEIALRMALGSSKKGIFTYYICESMLLLIIAALPALVISLNIMHSDLTINTLIDISFLRFIICFVSAFALIMLMIILGIFFPAYRAMKIKPAEALHED